MITVRTDGPDAWVAYRGTEPAGRLRTQVRPDRRCHLLLRDVDGDTCTSLLDAALPSLDGAVVAEVDETAADVQAALAGRGFAVSRREHHYLLPTDLSATGWPAVPPAFGTLSAARADVDRWRELDDALREDVPGTAGWRNDPREFARQLDDPAFDPATYLLAVDNGTGAYAGLVRVWINPTGPRLGMIAVLPPYRQRGLALGLLGAAFRVLHRRGLPEVSCEVDETNVASNALMARLGCRRTGGAVELVRPATTH